MSNGMYDNQFDNNEPIDNDNLYEDYEKFDEFDPKPPRKVINLDEAFTAVYKGDWVPKFFTAMILIIPTAIYQIAMPNLPKLMQGGIASAVGMVLGMIAMVIISLAIADPCSGSGDAISWFLVK